MKRTIVLFAALFVAITACFACTGVSKGDDIPIPLESLEFEEDTIIIRAPVIPIEASVDPVQSMQPERARKWHFGADASMSVVPSFALNKHQQQYELGLSFGRTLTPFFHLGLGASYVFYSGFADGLPVWINPRVYFSRNVSSMFLNVLYIR